MTPRVFSPTGGFAAEELAVGFSLGRSGPVTAKVFNRAGRLVRVLITGEPRNAGANIVRWDGRDSGGSIVEPGLYLVYVESNGQRQQETVGVVP